MGRVPGGPLAGRPLHFIWLADTSGSMNRDGKIQALNNAVREAVPHLRDAARQNPAAQLLVRAVTFSDDAQWHIAEPTPIDTFRWRDITQVGGVTNLGAALTLVARDFEQLSGRGLPPVLVLITDGFATDDAEGGLRKLEATAWGRKAVRVGIALGRDADRGLLARFMGGQDRIPLEATHPEALAQAIRWASTVAVGESSQVIRTDASPLDAESEPIRPRPVVEASDVW